jgi:hypothetical protein
MAEKAHGNDPDQLEARIKYRWKNQLTGFELYGLDEEAVGIVSESGFKGWFDEQDK